MASTFFVNTVTLTDDDWFNDLNRLHYTIFGDPANIQAISTAQAATTWTTQAANDNSTKIATTAYADRAVQTGQALRSYLAGLTLSTAGASPTMSIAAGLATDTTSVRLMALAAFTKGTGSWTVGSGNGGKMSAAALTTGWYHWFLIQRVDTGVVDVGFDVSATSPTLPTNYTLFRRIGSMKSDGTNWLSFIQDGDLFQWLVPVADVAAGNPGTSAVTRTLSVPTGLNILANIEVGLTSSTIGSAVIAYVSDLATTDTAAALGAASVASPTTASGGHSFSSAQVRTNTSSQIRSRISASDGGVTIYNNTLGWTDRRGRDA